MAVLLWLPSVVWEFSCFPLQFALLKPVCTSDLSMWYHQKRYVVVYAIWMVSYMLALCFLGPVLKPVFGFVKATLIVALMWVLVGLIAFKLMEKRKKKEAGDRN